MTGINTGAAAVLERLCSASLETEPPVTLFIVAHPDDEVIGAASRFPRLGVRASILHVTDGSPRNLEDARRGGFAERADYASARLDELARALALAGVEFKQVRSLGVIDQEASLHLHELPGRVAEQLAVAEPQLVVTHPYEGGHPDHDATAFAAHAACALLERGGRSAPVLAEMTSYHNSGAGLESGTFLTPEIPSDETLLILPPAVEDLKRRMLACFESQRETLRYFRTDIERFRIAPRYDFTSAPHAGRLFYEMYAWGMTGDRFRELAREAMARLGLSGRF
jgi:LmbE family N-acetylglucosaminyl deacetylase